MLGKISPTFVSVAGGRANTGLELQHSSCFVPAREITDVCFSKGCDCVLG